jgi:hypothetical protein
MSVEKKKIKVCMTESYRIYIVRESIEINVEDYPELDGMSDEDIQNYIILNASDMKPTNEEWYDSLYDELLGEDVIRDKITDEEGEIIVELI